MHARPTPALDSAAADAVPCACTAQAAPARTTPRPPPHHRCPSRPVAPPALHSVSAATSSNGRPRLLHSTVHVALTALRRRAPPPVPGPCDTAVRAAAAPAALAPPLSWRPRQTCPARQCRILPCHCPPASPIFQRRGSGALAAVTNFGTRCALAAHAPPHHHARPSMWTGQSGQAEDANTQTKWREIECMSGTRDFLTREERRGVRDETLRDTGCAHLGARGRAWEHSIV